MSWLLQVFLLVVSTGFLLYVLLMVRRDRFLLKYSIIWVVLGVLGVLAAAFPDGVSFVSAMLGFETPVNFVFLVCIVFLFVSALMFVAALSKQSQTIKALVQEISLLQASIDSHDQRDEPAKNL